MIMDIMFTAAEVSDDDIHAICSLTQASSDTQLCLISVTNCGCCLSSSFTSSTPAAGATTVGVSSNIVLTFSENSLSLTFTSSEAAGTGNIVISDAQRQ